MEEKIFDHIYIVIPGDKKIVQLFLQNKLFTECQPGFISGDLCIAQLLSITHQIYKSFDK